MLGAMWFWLALAALLMALRRGFLGYRAVPVGVKTLSAPEYATARVAAQILYPEGGAIPASGESASVALHADRFVGAQTWSNRVLMGLLFVAVEHGTLLFPPRGSGGWRRFTSLDADQQLAYLDSWRQSELPPRRLVFMSLRAILTMGYFADDGVLASLGLAPRELVAPPHEVDALWPPVGELPRELEAGSGTSEPGASSSPSGAGSDG